MQRFYSDVDFVLLFIRLPPFWSLSAEERTFFVIQFSFVFISFFSFLFQVQVLGEDPSCSDITCKFTCKSTR